MKEIITDIKNNDKLISRIDFLILNDINIEKYKDLKYLLEDILNNKLISSSKKENTEILLNNISIFNDLPKKQYFKDIITIQKYLNLNYSSWLIDQMDKKIIKDIEYFIDFKWHLENEEEFKKLNNSIKILEEFFSIKEHAFLSDEESEILDNLNQYVNNTIIRNSKIIIKFLISIKDSIQIETNPQEKEKVEESIKEVTEEIEENIELELPNIINNLYWYFSKLFNRKRNSIELNEILKLKKITLASDKFLNENKEIYWELILEQFKNFTSHIDKIDTDNKKEFNEKEIEPFFETLILIIKEISHIHKIKKI